MKLRDATSFIHITLLVDNLSLKMFRRRNDDEVRISESMQSADQLVSDRTCNDTKRNYASKIKKAVDWFKNNNNSNCLNKDNTEFILPIPSRPLLEFFGSI